jgi:hypothetical protein
LIEIRLGLRVRNSHYGSNGSDIGDCRWSSVNSIYIVGIAWAPTGVPKLLMVAAKVMRPWAIPAIGMPMGVMIWSIGICLSAQGV